MKDIKLKEGTKAPRHQGTEGETPQMKNENPYATRVKNDNVESKEVYKSKIRGDIAIIGMACIFPGAPNLKTYWQNIISKVDAVREVPPGRWDAQTHYSPDAGDINKVYCNRGGYLDEHMLFDPIKHEVMPVSVEGGEPDQFIILQVVHEALRDAGYQDCDLSGKLTEFILGRGNYLGVGASNLIQRSIVTEQTLKILKNLHPEYSKEELKKIRQELLSCLPPLKAETAGSFIPNLITGRTANRLNFMGPNYTIDAACASSLIATEIGVQDLLTQKCDLAIVGGIHIFASVPFLLIFCAFQAMSHSSQIRPFDEKADGTIPGEGAGVVILKRLEDAQQDGDRNYAVIKGVGTSSDGRAVSVTAPRVEGEELALRRAYEMAKICPDSIKLIEAHGVGTTVGDVVELEAMRRVFRQRDTLSPQCALGSVKSMIGHAMPAAGIASLIKTALSIYHKILPPTLHCETINPKLQIEKTPFYINTETRPWIHGEKQFPRRAGVNAFGFGGINAHVILEEHTSHDSKNKTDITPQLWETEVCIFHGTSRQSLIEQMMEVKGFLARFPNTILRDLAYTLNIHMDIHPFRLAVVASSIETLQRNLDYALQRLADPKCVQVKDIKGIYYSEFPLSKEGKLAFLFPGEGAQYLNMLSDLCFYFPEVRSCFDKADQILLEQGQKDLPSSYIFPPPFFSKEEQKSAEKLLWRMDRATEAVLIGNLAMYTLLNSLGIKPDQMVGHSAGEWSAMIFSGIIDVEEFLQNTRKLNRIYRKLSEDPDIPKATLIAAGTSLSKISDIIKKIDGKIYIANDNCPHQVVIIGEEPAAQQVIKQLKMGGVPSEILPFDRGYHTPLFSPICPHLREYFASFTINPPHTEIFSCNIGAPYPKDPEKILKLAVETWVLPVAFRQAIENMYNSGTRIFVEVGPKGNLTAFVEDILRGKHHLAVPSNVARRSGITQLNHMVGLLSSQGVAINLDYLYHYRSPEVLPLFNGKPKKAETRNSMELSLGWYSLRVKKPVIKQNISPQVNAGASSNGGKEYKFDDTQWPMSNIISKMIASEFPEEVKGNISSGIQVDPTGFSNQKANSSIMGEYFQTMEHFLETQKEMMQTYLGNKENEPEERVIPYHNENVIEKEAQVNEIEKMEAPLDKNSPITEEALKINLMELVSEKTGYPPEMIDFNLDIEGDLGIDSIKRVEIIGSIREKYSAIKEDDIEEISNLKTLQQVLDFLKIKIITTSEQIDTKNRQTAPGPIKNSPFNKENGKLPFIGTIENLSPGEFCVVLRKIDLGEDLFLKDHRFGQKISEKNDQLGALPVIPLTVSIEIMAEVASILFPELKLVKIDNITATQWISFEENKSITLRITAETTSETLAQVKIQKWVEHAPSPKPLITGTFFFAEDYPVLSNPEPIALKEERAPSHTAEQVYSEHRMFHGPRFQGIASMDKVGQNGLEAHLKQLPIDNLFLSNQKPKFIIDPFLLDAAGQLVGYWPVEYLESGFVIFPIAVRAVHIYQDPPPLSKWLKTSMRLQQITNNNIIADLEIMGENDQPWVKIIGWTDWRFYWSQQLYDFWRFPSRGTIGKIFTPRFQEKKKNQTPIISILRQFWQNKDDLFQHVMAYMVLSQKERTIYQKLANNSLSQGNWLLKRMVIKDVAKSYWQKYHHQTLFPADIDIPDNEQDWPNIKGNGHNELPAEFILSVVHKDNTAMAIAAPKGLKVGITLQKLQEPKEFSLHSQEYALLSLVEKSEQEEWTQRLLSAKEAISKALQNKKLGKGECLLQELDPQTGIVKASFNQGQKSSVSTIRGNNLLEVFTLRENDYIAAITTF